MRGTARKAKTAARALPAHELAIFRAAAFQSVSLPLRNSFILERILGVPRGWSVALESLKANFVKSQYVTAANVLEVVEGRSTC